MSKRKRVLFTIVTIILLVLFAEVSLQAFYRLSVGRWFWEWWAIPIFEEDPVRVYRVKPNLDYLHKTREFTARYCTDQFGMRTEPGKEGPAISKSNDTFRIMAFGPSFTFGWGVNYEDSYMYQLAKELQVPGKRVELINLGTPSQPVPYQLKWLKAVGYRYQPDLIVQTVYGGAQNIDVDDTLPDDRPCVRNGYLYPSGRMTFSLWIRRMRTYSAVLFYGWHAYHALRSSDAAPGDGREFYSKISSGSSAVGDAVRRYENYAAYIQVAVTNKPQIVFLVVPMAYVVRLSDVSRVAHHPNVGNPLAVRAQTALLTSALETNHVHMVNPTEALVENDKATRMYNLYDIHFTAAGNKVVADYSLPLIQEIVQKNIRIGR